MDTARTDAAGAAEAATAAVLGFAPAAAAAAGCGGCRAAEAHEDAAGAGWLGCFCSCGGGGGGGGGGGCPRGTGIILRGEKKHKFKYIFTNAYASASLRTSPALSLNFCTYRFCWLYVTCSVICCS